jgi:putative acetyltransferase
MLILLQVKQGLDQAKMNIIIRKETESDYRAVEELTREAFWNLYVPGCTEHYILHNLRKSRDFVPELDFIAEKDGQIVGNSVYSRGTIKHQQGAEHTVLCFGPVSVLPAFQKQGIGSALIVHTIGLAKTMDCPAIFIYGDPRYYSRFGFRCAEKYDIKTADGKFAIALLALELKPGTLSNMPGRFIESPAFEADPDKFAEYEAKFPDKEKLETDSQREFKLLASLRY